MDPSASYASIEVLIGNENSVYSQNGQGAIPPQTRNGNINVLLSDSPSSSPTSQPSSLSIDRRLRRLDEKESKVYPSNILLACPMHARYLTFVIFVIIDAMSSYHSSSQNVT